MEKTTKIKLYILSGLVMAVIAFVCVMYSQITIISDVTLTTSSFKEEILHDAKENIPPGGSSFALSQYRQICDEIVTENMLGKVSKELKDSCLSIANAAIVKNISNVSRHIMKSGNWNSEKLASIESNCKFALSMHAASSSQKNSMEKILSTIKKYRDACSICSASHRFNGEEGNKNIIEQANTYIGDAALQSCHELINNLQSVRSNLYQAHLAHVKALRTNEACDGFINMASIYGKSASELRYDISSISTEISKKEKEQSWDDVQQMVEDVDENDW